MRRVFFVHEGPLRTATNCNCKFLFSTKGREERRLLFVHEGPLRIAKNGNCNFFLSTKGREGPRRTATAELLRQHLFPRRTRRDTENCNCRTSFFPRRAAKDHEELQLQNFYGNTFFHGGHGGTRRTATAELPFFHEGPRRTTKNCNCRTSTATPFSTEDTEGHGELQRQLLLSTGATKPRKLTGQLFLEACRLLVTGLVGGRGDARQRTGCDEGIRSMRHVFVGGRCGGAAPAQGRAEGPTAQNTQMRGERNTFAGLVQGCESGAAA